MLQKLFPSTPPDALVALSLEDLFDLLTVKALSSSSYSSESSESPKEDPALLPEEKPAPEVQMCRDSSQPAVHVHEGWKIFQERDEDRILDSKHDPYCFTFWTSPVSTWTLCRVDKGPCEMLHRIV